MDFGGDTGYLQRKIAETLEGEARRMAVFDALAIETGQAILDLGCGGGHLVREIALAVGDSGRAVGLDAEQAFASVSAKRGVRVPETAQQRDWLKSNQAARKRKTRQQQCRN